jgi:hypothetical protein
MPPPIKILHCVVCEEARHEVGNKMTILGFFGIVPNVQIFVSSLQGPTKLLLLFLAQTTSPKIDLTGELRHENGTVIVSAKMGLDTSGSSPNFGKVNFGFGFAAPLKLEGKHNINLFWESTKIYEDNIFITLQSPGPAKS